MPYWITGLLIGTALVLWALTALKPRTEFLALVTPHCSARFPA